MMDDDVDSPQWVEKGRLRPLRDGFTEPAMIGQIREKFLFGPENPQHGPEKIGVGRRQAPTRPRDFGQW